jgi:hypothetical protein
MMKCSNCKPYLTKTAARIIPISMDDGAGLVLSDVRIQMTHRTEWPRRHCNETTYIAVTLGIINKSTIVALHLMRSQTL